MAIRAQVLTAWLNEEGPPGVFTRLPRVTADHPPTGWVDVTGTPSANIPPSPNAIVVEGVWDDAAFAALESDPAYAGAVIWSETP